MNKILAIVVALALCACGSKKGATAGADYGHPSTSAPIMEAPQIKAGVAQIAEGYGQWQKLRIPVKVEVEAGKSLSASGTAVMVRDKSIHLSLRYWGIEIGWLYLTADTITIADKYHKRYMKEAVKPFMANVPVTVANVQDLLLGRMFAIGSSNALTDAEAAAGSAGYDDIYFFIPQENGGEKYSCGFGLQTTTPASFSLAFTVIGAGDRPVQCSYASPIQASPGTVSPTVTMAYTTGKTPLKASFEWNFDKSRIDGAVSEPRISLEGYSRVSLETIMKMINTL